MDGQNPNQKPNPRSNLIPGMGGAGDCSGTSYASLSTADRPTERDTSGTSRPPKIRKPLHYTTESNQMKVEDDVNDNNNENDEDESDEESAEDDSEIEPLCSYPYGYMKRQTVYVCMTCTDPSKEGWKPAGICIGCRHACHQGHEVISLETRRNFRCDCGNKKFPETCRCNLWPEKEDTNEQNIYNNNYKGKFCSCKCKESDCVEEDPLYQCVVCEDWFHASHCNASTEGIEKNYTDLICGECTPKLEFLRYYEPFDPNSVVDENAIDEMIKYTDIDSESDEDDDGKKPDNSETEECKLKTLTKKDPYTSGQLWTLGWRGKLCRCSTCKEMYAALNVSYLLDKDDETRRYFSAEGEEETQSKIVAAVRRFEEWLLQMNAEERETLFSSGPDVVKQKMKEYFESLTGTEEGEEEFTFDDTFLDQLFEAFSEFILDAEGGADYLFDVDALEKAVANGHRIEGEEDNDEEEECDSAGDQEEKEMD